MIKAIETQYQGYRFRSRLEARWAVFFDALGVKWEYEPEGFDLGELGYYLPDFWLPEKRLFVEVKPEEFGGKEREKCRSLAMQTGFGCLMLSGAPTGICYPFFDYSDGPEHAERIMTFDDGGALVLGYLIGIDTQEKVDEFWNTLDKNARESIHRLATAEAAARGARFEHGEHGTRRHR